MAEKDKDFVCPDCFSEVAQSGKDSNGLTVYYCSVCGLGPLIFCGKCLGLITEDCQEDGDCPYCKMESVKIEVMTEQFSV